LKKRKKSKTGRNNLENNPENKKKKNTASVRKNISKGCNQETEKKNHKVFFQSKSSRYYLPLKERASFTALKTYFY